MSFSDVHGITHDISFLKNVTNKKNISMPILSKLFQYQLYIYKAIESEFFSIVKTFQVVYYSLRGRCVIPSVLNMELTCDIYVL